MKELWAKGPTTDWELIDTECAGTDIMDLMSEYVMTFGPGWEFEIR